MLYKLAEVFQKQYNRKHAASPRVHQAPPKTICTPPAKGIQLSSSIKSQQPHIIPPDGYDNNNKPLLPHRYNTRYQAQQQHAYAVVDPESGKLLEYRHLKSHPTYKTVWQQSMSNELGRLAQGNSKVAGTNTLYFIEYGDIPQNRIKDVTYA